MQQLIVTYKLLSINIFIGLQVLCFVGLGGVGSAYIGNEFASALGMCFSFWFAIVASFVYILIPNRIKICANPTTPIHHAAHRSCTVFYVTFMLAASAVWTYVSYYSMVSIFNASNGLLVDAHGYKLV